MTKLEFYNQLISLGNNLERFALDLTSTREEAIYLLQETYLKALNYKNKFVDFTILKAWLLTIMKNTFINNDRNSISKNPILDITEHSFLLYNLKELLLVRPDSVYAYKEINNTIDAFEDEYKIPFRMHNEGYKYKEIAEILDIKIGTAKSRIFFMRKKLMETLNAYP